MAKRKTIIGLMTSFLLCVAAVCFAACGETKTFAYITVGIAGVKNDNQASLCVERYYGDTADLNNFVITATYTNNTTQTLSIDEVQVDVTVDGSPFTLAEYDAAVNAGGLSVGNYVLTFGYQDNQFLVSIIVKQAVDDSNYTINLNTATTQMGGKTLSAENSMFYGTDDAKISFDICNGSKIEHSVAERKIYILMRNDESVGLEYYDVSLGLPENLKTPAEYYDDNLLAEMDITENSNTWSTLNPGKYLVCANVKIDSNHTSTYTAFQTITVEKAPFVVDNATVNEADHASYNGIKFEWNYSFSSIYKYNVPLDYMIETRLAIAGEGFSGEQFALVLSQDDSAKSYRQKIALNNIVDTVDENQNSIYNILYYGNFVAVAEDGQTEVLFNAKAEYQKVKVKFVPNKNFQDLYAESAPFDILVKVNPGTHYMQSAQINSINFGFDTNGQVVPNMLTISEEQSPFQIDCGSGISYSYDLDAGKHVFSTTAAGSYSVTFKFKGDYNNYFWIIPDNLNTNGYTYTTNKINYNGQELITSITYSWTISKLNLATDYTYGLHIYDAENTDRYIHIVDESTENQSVFAIYVGIGCVYNENVNLTANDVALDWTVKPVGTSNRSGFVSTVTGELHTYEGKDANVYKKIVLSAGEINQEDFVYIAVEISFAGNVNFTEFRTTLVLIVQKLDYVKQLDLTGVFSTFEDTATETNYLYYVDSIGQEFSTITTSFDSTSYTYTIQSLSTYEDIEDFSQTMQVGHYQIVFTPVSDKPFLKVKTYEFWILENEPSSADDFAI